MTPNDDPLWPRCGPTPCGDFRSQLWCDHVSQKIRNHQDQIETGMRVCIPVVPDWKQYAEVSIGEETAPGFAEMALVRHEPFSTDEELLSLGMWTEGEGRASIAHVVRQWILSQIPGDNTALECKQKNHSFTQWQRAEVMKSMPKWIKANEWSILYNDMCIPCQERYQQFGSQMNDPNNTFGLAGVTGPTSPTNEALRNRFGS